ncbi:hypothetical protein P7C70_g4382, partial [Phenoliferia sp. Uapishka_3]
MKDGCDCPGPPSFSFTQGVLLGQASFVVLAVLFLKYVVFEDPHIARQQTKSKSDLRGKAKRHKSQASVAAVSPIPAILSQLAYDLPTHPPETLDWLNVLLAQTLVAYRTLVSNSTAGNGGAKGLMEEMLNRKGSAEGEAGDQPGLVGIDAIVVADVEVGDKFPVLSSARVRPSGESGGVRVEVDLDYSDHVSLEISTCVVVNFPRPRFAVLPIRLGLTLERFSGTLTLELPSPLSPSASTLGHTHPTLNLSLHPDFTLDLSTTSLLGSRAKLQDVPKVEQLILARIRGFIQDRVVWPGRVQVALPGLSTTHALGEGAGEASMDGDDGGWEWVEEAAVGRNADSDDEEDSIQKSEDGEEATIDVDADGGPAIRLHPTRRSCWKHLGTGGDKRADLGSCCSWIFFEGAGQLVCGGSQVDAGTIHGHIIRSRNPQRGPEVKRCGLRGERLATLESGRCRFAGPSDGKTSLRLVGASLYLSRALPSFNHQPKALKLTSLSLGRRILRLHLTLHLSTALESYPDLSQHYITQKSIDSLLETRELGASAGATLGLERAMRWREVRMPTGTMGGLFKARGSCLEALAGAVYMTHIFKADLPFNSALSFIQGIAASKKLFEASILPNMSLPGTLTRALKGEKIGKKSGANLSEVQTPLLRAEV